MLGGELEEMRRAINDCDHISAELGDRKDAKARIEHSGRQRCSTEQSPGLLRVRKPACPKNIKTNRRIFVKTQDRKRSRVLQRPQAKIRHGHHHRTPADQAAAVPNKTVATIVSGPEAKSLVRLSEFRRLKASIPKNANLSSLLGRRGVHPTCGRLQVLTGAALRRL
jgi:hypothetical protein